MRIPEKCRYVAIFFTQKLYVLLVFLFVFLKVYTGSNTAPKILNLYKSSSEILLINHFLLQYNPFASGCLMAIFHQGVSHHFHYYEQK